MVRTRSPRPGPIVRGSYNFFGLLALAHAHGASVHVVRISVRLPECAVHSRGRTSTGQFQSMHGILSGAYLTRSSSVPHSQSFDLAHDEARNAKSLLYVSPAYSAVGFTKKTERVRQSAHSR